MTDGHATFLLFTQASVMIMAHSKMLIFGFFRMSVRQSSRNVCTARPSVATVKVHGLDIVLITVNGKDGTHLGALLANLKSSKKAEVVRVQAECIPKNTCKN